MACDRVEFGGIEAGGERLVAKPYVRVRRADAVGEAVPTVTPGEVRR